MKIWAVANQKGGVGKTTTAVTLGGQLAKCGSRTLLIDLDPHGSLSAYFGADPDELEDSVYHLFRGGAGDRPTPLAALLYRTRFPGLTLLPASTALATLDRQLAGKDGMGLIIKQVLAGCTNKFDQVLIDCPPVMGVLMVNALAACQTLLIPVQTEHLALKGLQRMRHTLDMILQAGRADLRYLIIPTMYDRRTRACMDALRVLRQEHAAHLWNGVIPIDTRFREASKQGIPLSLLQPGGRGARAYFKLLEHLQQDQVMEQAERPVSA